MVTRKTKGSTPLRLTVDAQEFKTAEEFHTWIAEKLKFPSYYGANLSALADCLGDLNRPVHLKIQGLEYANNTMKEFFSKVIKIVQRTNDETNSH